VIVLDAVGFVHRPIARRALLLRAQAHAKAMGRTLVMVDGKTQDSLAHAAKRENLLRGKVVIFIEGLERVANLPAMWRMCLDATGDDWRKVRHVFVHHVRGWTPLTAYLSGARYLVTAAPPDAPGLEFRRVRRDPYRPALSRARL